MTDSTDPPPSAPSPPGRRRSSFAGQTFAELFGNGRTRPSVGANTNANTNNNQISGSITSAAAQAQQRRMSLTTMGLSGSPTQNPFGAFRRRDSISSANSGSLDESVIEDDISPPPQQQPSQSNPTTPFARRMSFGARALRDVKANTTGSGGNGSPTGSLEKSNEGYNWADNFRNRAERSASINSAGGGGGSSPKLPNHMRAKSVATMEPPPVSPPPPKQQNVPDHFQERILKGDFYMD